MRLRMFSLLLLTGIVACTPTIANRGNNLDAEKLASVQAGSSTREEVATTLGSPTLISTFDDKIWYYVGRETKQYSFFDPEVVNQKAVEVKFDDQGVVTSVKNLDVAATAREVSPVDRRTPTYGNDDTFIKQLLGNLSHPTPGTQARKEGQ